MLKKFLILSTLSLSVAATASTIEPAQSIDLNAYLGTWYEQARIPNKFQDNTTKDNYGACTHTSATYAELPNGKISVTNRCLRVRAADPIDTKEDITKGIATVVRGSNNTQLKVNFTGIPLLQTLGIGDGDYWILAVGKNSEGGYDWALVGGPKHDFGWILARDTLDDVLVSDILNYAESIGYKRADFIDQRSAAE